LLRKYVFSTDHKMYSVKSQADFDAWLEEEASYLEP
jgi:hypothetical protein